MKKKNIIFYFSDQQRWDTINETVSPNLCHLAEEGVKFENNFTCQPVCGPARACLQSGNTQHKSDATGTEYRCPKTQRPQPIISMMPAIRQLISASGTLPLTVCRVQDFTVKRPLYQKTSRAVISTGVLPMFLNSLHTAMTAMFLTVTETSLISKATELTVLMLSLIHI